MKRTASQRRSSSSSSTSDSARGSAVASAGPTPLWSIWLWGLALTFACTLWLATPEPIPIFVSRRLLAIHFLFAIPLAILVGEWIRNRWYHPWIWMILAIACSFAFAALLPGWSDALLPSSLGFASRWWIRTAVALGLATLWCAARLRLQSFSQPNEAGGGMPSWTRVALVAALGMVPTWIYSREVLLTSIEAAERDLASPWVARSARSLQQAVEIDDLAKVGGRPAKQQWLDRLRTLDDLEHRLGQIEPASNAQSIEASVPLLLALGRSREAVERLHRSESRTPTSYLLEAICYSDLGDWQSTLDACDRSKDLLAQFQPDEKQRWYELRSEALTRLRRTAEALACLLEAAIACPTAAPMFSMQAALQRAELGEVPAALQELQAIRGQHPEMAIAIDRQLRRLQTQSCTLPSAGRFGGPSKSGN
ncbi:MAG: hypothetical protein ACK5OB_14815 [Pirellula sp.]